MLAKGKRNQNIFFRFLWRVLQSRPASYKYMYEWHDKIIHSHFNLLNFKSRYDILTSEGWLLLLQDKLLEAN